MIRWLVKFTAGEFHEAPALFSRSAWSQPRTTRKCSPKLPTRPGRLPRVLLGKLRGPSPLRQVAERSSGTAFGSLTLPRRLQSPVRSAHPPAFAAPLLVRSCRAAQAGFLPIERISVKKLFIILHLPGMCLLRRLIIVDLL